MSKLSLSPEWEFIDESEYERALFKAKTGDNEVKLFGTGGLKIEDGNLDLILSGLKNFSNINFSGVDGPENNDLIVSDGDGNLESTDSVSIDVLNQADLTTALELEVLESDGSGNLRFQSDVSIEVLNGADILNASSDSLLAVSSNGNFELTDSIDLTRLTLENSQLSKNIFRHTDTGLITQGDAVVLFINKLRDGESIQIHNATLTLEDGSPAPTGLDFAFVDMTNNTSTVFLSGDGSTTYSNEKGGLFSYVNNTGNEIQISIVVDNGNYGSGVGDFVRINTRFTAQIVR